MHPQRAVACESRARTPGWDLYESGLAERDPARARDRLSAAHSQFTQAGDGLGRLLASCAILASIETSWESFEGFAHWLQARDEALRECEGPRPAEQDLRIAIGFFCDVKGSPTGPAAGFVRALPSLRQHSEASWSCHACTHLYPSLLATSPHRRRA